MTDHKTKMMEHWAVKLQLPPELLMARGLHVIRESKVVATDRVVTYRTGETALLLLPTSLDKQVEAQIVALLPSRIDNGDLPQELPLRRRWRDLIYYQDTITPPRLDGDKILPITCAEEGHLQQLQNACSERDNQLGQISIDDPLIVGYFVQGELAGAASLLYEDAEAIADIGALVHPAYRGQGIAQAIVQHLSNLGVAQGRTIQYTTMANNFGSVRTAEKSGFKLLLIEDGFELLS
jgi:ribosomal protein S18 acetylase RimI-like enzyme